MKIISTKGRLFIFMLLFFLICMFFFYIFTERDDNKPESFDKSTEILDTYMDQHIYCDATLQKSVAEKAVETASELASRLSWKNENSDVWNLNSEEGKKKLLNDDFYEMMKTLISIAENSGGAYDPALLPLVKVWGFDTSVGKIPEEEALATAKAASGYEKILIDGLSPEATLNGQSAGVDLTHISKGAVLDSVLEVYKNNAIQGAMCAVGTSIGVYGSKPDASKWTMAVRDPRGEPTDRLGVLEFSKGCISTAGDYNNFFVENNRVYFDILDRKTGYPASKKIMSATVVSSSGLLSDALAYACVVMGKDECEELLSMYDASVILVTEEKEVYISEAIYNDFHLVNNDYKLYKM